MGENNATEHLLAIDQPSVSRYPVDATASHRSRSAIDGLNRSRALPYMIALLAVVPALRAADQLPDISPLQIAQCIAVAILLPLFPFHGVFVKAVTRSRGYLTPLSRYRCRCSDPTGSPTCRTNFPPQFSAPCGCSPCSAHCTVHSKHWPKSAFRSYWLSPASLPFPPSGGIFAIAGTLDRAGLVYVRQP